MARGSDITPGYVLGAAASAVIVLIIGVGFACAMGAAFLLGRYIDHSKWINVEAHALQWNTLKWIAQPTSWIARTVSTGAVIAVALHYLNWYPLTNANIFVALVLFVLCVGTDALIIVIEKAANTPQLKQKKAGIDAEIYVQRIIDKEIREHLGAESIHSRLFVFNAHTKDEYSAEIDHLLITDKNVYLIETKYKSGTIYANSDADRWVVRSVRGEDSMRNALKQVKNTAQILSRQIKLSKPIIPVVAIFGKDTKVVGNPGNVDLADNLPRMILAFERNADRKAIDPSKVAALFEAASTSDSLAMERHVARIEVRRELIDDKRIVTSASVE